MTIPLLRGMAALAPHYDGFILDLWGVVHDGVAPLPGALECLRALRSADKRIVLLSNAPRRSDDVIERITRIGVPEGLYHHVMSSGEEAWQHLHRRDDPFYAALGRKCLHVGSERDLLIREGLELDFVDSPGEASFILNTGPAGWEDRIEDYMPLLHQALARELPMVCANPDLVVMHGSRLALCAGALAQWYERPERKFAGTASRSPRSTTPASGCSASTTAGAFSRWATACAPTSPALPPPVSTAC